MSGPLIHLSTYILYFHFHRRFFVMQIWVFQLSTYSLIHFGYLCQSYLYIFHWKCVCHLDVCCNVMLHMLLHVYVEHYILFGNFKSRVSSLEFKFKFQLKSSQDKSRQVKFARVKSRKVTSSQKVPSSGDQPISQNHFQGKSFPYRTVPNQKLESDSFSNLKM